MKSSGQWQKCICLKGLPKSICPLRRKKWGCYTNDCMFVISGIVALFSSLSPVYHADFKLVLFRCGPSVTCFCLLCGKHTVEHSSALFTPNGKTVVERVDIWIFSFAINTLLFRKKVTPPPDPRLQPESCLLLQPTPTRGGQKAHVSSRTNTYILVDSGLRVRISSDTKLCIQNFIKSMQKKVFWV